MDNKEIALLVEKAKENDKSAMGKLYNETHKKAYFVALKMTKNEDDAMDILQDSFVKAFKKIDTLENPEQFQSWLNQIVANKCRDYLKKKKEIFFSETEDEDGNSIEDTFEEENISLIPDKSLDTAETKRLVMNIIEGLSEDQKLCVLMYYYENMSVGDIAEALECSTGTVKSRLNYARQKIKTEVENLEKTQGIKLYGIAPVPFVVWVLMRMSESTVVPRDIAPLVIESAVGTAGAAGAATAAGGTVGAAAGVGAGATGATAITGKTIALISAGVIAVGGIGVAVAVTNSEPENVPVSTSVVETTTYETTTEVTFAPDYEGNTLSFIYEYKGEIDGIVITKYTGFANSMEEAANPVIPTEIDGKQVKVIGTNAFKSYDIKTVTIPDTVTKIEDGAFSSCISLTNLNLPNELTIIGDNAFAYCFKISDIVIPAKTEIIGENAFLYSMSLTNVNFLGDNTVIKSGAFGCCDKLKEIKLPDKLLTIEPNTFNSCTSLEKIEIPNGVTSIKESAFQNCTSLEEIVIPDNVTTISSGAFFECTNLANITLSNNLENIDFGAFGNCSSLVEITIPENVKTIGERAFSSCTNLKKVTLSNSIENMDAGVFLDCSNLNEIVISNGLSSIDMQMFAGCTNLSEVLIPYSVKEINDGAFLYCTNLKKVTIPNSVTTIGYQVFGSCTSLTEITLPDSVTYIDKTAFYDCPNIVVTYKGKTYTYAEIGDLYNDINNQ